MPYWQLDFDKNEENKKKVVAKVVEFYSKINFQSPNMHSEMQSC